MKYQQLENLESGWKWKYLVKKHREGEPITRYIEASAAQDRRAGSHDHALRPKPDWAELQELRVVQREDGIRMLPMP